MVNASINECRGRSALGAHSGRGAAGFTLIELMTVVAIIAVLSLIATPEFKILVAKQRTKSAASTLHTALMKARSEAVKRNVNVTITPAAGGWQAGWQILDGAEVLEDQSALASVLVAGGPASVIYQSAGRITGAPPTFQVKSSAVSSIERCVSADTSGRPYSKDSAC